VITARAAAPLTATGRDYRLRRRSADSPDCDYRPRRRPAHASDRDYRPAPPLRWQPPTAIPVRAAAPLTAPGSDYRPRSHSADASDRDYRPRRRSGNTDRDYRPAPPLR